MLNKLTAIAIIVSIILLGIERVSSAFKCQTDLPRYGARRRFYQSLLFMLIGGYALIFIFATLELYFSPGRVTIATSIFGFGLFFFGFLLRRAAIHALGHEWDIGIRITRRQRLISHGIYKYIAHPYHSAVILELAGICVMAHAYWTMCFLISFQIPLLIFRIFFEEKLLHKKFGEDYRKYLRTLPLSLYR